MASIWATLPEKVRLWAEEVKHDVDTPDLWAELQREREILTGARYEAVENTLFTPDEQAEIAKQLREIKEYVKKTYSLSSEQMSRVEARLDEAEAATLKRPGFDAPFVKCEQPAGCHGCERSSPLRLRRVAAGRGGA